MSVSATVSAAQLAAARAALESAGHGPNTFLVPLHPGNAATTHYGLHSWDDDGFISAIENLSVPTLQIRNNPGLGVNFEDHISQRGLERHPGPEPSHLGSGRK